MKNCPYCDEQIQDDAKKCRHCGEWLNREIKDTNERVVNSITSESKSRSRAKIWIAIMGVAVFVFVIVGIGSQLSTNEMPKKYSSESVNSSQSSKKQKEEDPAQKQAREEAQKKAEEEQKAKELAEQKAWEKTKAGQICLKHSEWSKTDCEKIADKQYWIGMSYDMLVELGGKPNSANPSNYGNGTQWQWCWHNKTPSCFYGSDDGIVDSYN